MPSSPIDVSVRWRMLGTLQERACRHLSMRTWAETLIYFHVGYQIAELVTGFRVQRGADLDQLPRGKRVHNMEHLNLQSLLSLTLKVKAERVSWMGSCIAPKLVERSRIEM